MRFAVGILLLLALPNVSASFFDDFQNAMSSLKNNFGRLLTDVITDVKDTIDCTILAVEHVLSMNRYRAAEYEKKCKGQKATPAVVTPVDIHKVSREIAEKKEVFTKEVEAEIEDSLDEINDEICDTLGHKRHPSLSNIKEILKSNTNRLSEINQILKQELEKISDDIKKKFARKLPLTEPSIDSVYNDLLILQEAGQNNENNPKERQIDKVFDKILYILDVKNDSNNATIAGLANDLKEEKEILTEEGRLSESIDNEIEIFESMSTEIVKEQTTTEYQPEELPITESTATPASITREESTTTPAPTTPEEPTTSSAPTTAEDPTTTTAPSTTQEPSTTPAPTTTQKPTTTPVPTTTQEPTTTPAPTTTEEPTTIPPPITTEEPTTTPAPTTTQEPTTTPAPTTTEKPTTTPAPTTTEEPTTTLAPTTTEEPTTTPAPTTTEEPTTTQDPTTTKGPTTPMPVPTTTLKPVSTTLPPEFYSVFNVAKKDSKAHKDAVQQAKNMFKQHKYSKVVMNKLFNNPDIKTRSVFDGLF